MAAAIAAAAIASAPAPATAQGQCVYVDRPGSPVWFAVEGGAGIAAPLPVSGAMKIQSAAATWTVGVSAYHESLINASLMLSMRNFDGKISTYDHVDFLDVVLRVGYPVISTPAFDWHIFIQGGAAKVGKQYLKVKTDPNTGQPMFTVDPVTGKAVPQGSRVTQNMTAGQGGWGTRFTIFPVNDVVGIYLDSSMSYTAFKDLGTDEGALSISVLAGALVQF